MVVVEPGLATPKVAPPDTVVVVTEVVVVSVRVVVDSDAPLVVEFAPCVEEPSLDCETAVDEESAELVVVEIEEAPLPDWNEEELTSPQPARREVAAATRTSVAKATLNLFKLATKC